MAKSRLSSAAVEALCVSRKLTILWWLERVPKHLIGSHNPTLLKYRDCQAMERLTGKRGRVGGSRHFPTQTRPCADKAYEGVSFGLESQGRVPGMHNNFTGSQPTTICSWLVYFYSKYSTFIDSYLAKPRLIMPRAGSFSLRVRATV